MSVPSDFASISSPLGHLACLSAARTFSVSPENPTGGKRQGGGAGEGNSSFCAWNLGVGWKINPFLWIAAGETITLVDLSGSGTIKQIWMTPTGNYRNTILRIYWEDQTSPSIEVPAGDFFASAYTSFVTFAQISSLAVWVNPGYAFNCY